MLLLSQVVVGQPVRVKLPFHMHRGCQDFIGTVLEKTHRMVKVSCENNPYYGYVYANFHELHAIYDFDDDIPF